MVRIWDKTLNAFRDAQAIRRYDKDLRAWVDVEAAYITEDGVKRQVWPERLYLYKDGDECTRLTNGWGAVRIAYGSDGVFGAVSKSGTYIRVTGTNIDATTGVCTNQEVPISHYSGLYARVKKAQKGVDYNGAQYDSAVTFRCCDSCAIGDYRISYGNFPTNPIGNTAGTLETGVDVTLCVDISKIDIDAHILITGYGAKEYYIYEVWLER